VAYSLTSCALRRPDCGNRGYPLKCVVSDFLRGRVALIAAIRVARQEALGQLKILRLPQN